jgi:hypothetical protein
MTSMLTGFVEKLNQWAFHPQPRQLMPRASSQANRSEHNALPYTQARNSLILLVHEFSGSP